MRKYISISIGGMLGALLRVALKNVRIMDYQGTFPLNTLVINVAGSFLLAFLLSAALDRPDIDKDIRLGAATGFLGAFTTFSAFCKETVLLMDSGLYFPAIANMILSVALGLSAAYLGVILAGKANAKRTITRMKTDRTETTVEDGVE